MLEGVVPYPLEFAADYRAKGYWTDRSLVDTFDEVFVRYAERTALVFGDQRLTFAEVGKRVERLALHLLKLGMKPLDRVVVQLPNVPEFVYLYFALQKVGAIPLTALPRHRYLEISHFVTQTVAVAYAIPDRLGDFDFIELAEQIKAESPSMSLVLVHGDDVPEGYVSLRVLCAEDSGLSPSLLDEVVIDPDDPACFQLSGGTTGVPKVIPRTHNDYALNSLLSADAVGLGEEDALLVVLPIAHNFPLASPGIQGALMRGARCVLSTSTRAADVLPLIERERVTHLELVPALLVAWLNDPEWGNHDLSSIRIVTPAGQRAQPELKRRVEQALSGCGVHEAFGMAEGLLMYVPLDSSPTVRYETCGRPVCEDDEIKLLDDDGNVVADGEVGELAVRGPYTIRGYYKAEEHNAVAFTADGFYLTGDLLQRHASGNYIVAGRKKDLVNRGGEKISAEEVENLMLAYPPVQNVAIVPMPDPVLGERMCVYVIPHQGQHVELGPLNDFLVQKGLAKFKLPERLELVSEFPLSSVGKVSKKALERALRLICSGGLCGETTDRVDLRARGRACRLPW